KRKDNAEAKKTRRNAEPRKSRPRRAGSEFGPYNRSANRSSIWSGKVWTVSLRREEEPMKMMRKIWAVAAVGWRAGLGVRAKEAKHAMTFDDLIKLQRVAEPAISPDGKWVAYTVSTPDMEANRNASNIWMMATSEGDAIQLTQSGKDSSPVWSPDGKT